MDRQNPVSNSQETSPVSDREFGRWLTRDLRAKGAPLSSPPPLSPPPSSPPPSEAQVLAGWLTRDLTPKNSLRPRASLSPSASAPSVARDAAPSLAALAAPLAAAPSSATPLPAARLAAAPLPAAVLTAPLPAAPSAPLPVPLPISPFRDLRISEPVLDAAPLRHDATPRDVVAVEPLVVAVPPQPQSAAAARVAPTPLDSLAPQEVPEPPSLPVVAPASLDDDDLAVLPGRRRAARSDRKKYAFVLLGVLCFAAAIMVGLRQRGGSDAASASELASPTDLNAALPPPPPSADELPPPEQPSEDEPARRAGRRTAEPDDALDPLDPRNLLGGPSVRRYADVPSPTLSRLAREHRRLQRERDEAVRKAKAKDNSR